MYDYLENVEDDVREFIDNEVDLNEFLSREKLEEYLNDTLFDDDNVTGNGSGSYTFSRAKATEYLENNFDLLWEAFNEFGSFDTLKEGPEACDVTIRCYVLPQAISNVLDELNLDYAEET